MNKLILKIFVFLTAFSVLTACSDDGVKQSSQPEKQTTETKREATEEIFTDITISLDNGKDIVTEKKIAIKDGDILMDVLKDNFTIETSPDGSFITSIEGIEANDKEKKAWMYFVNDEMATVGAKEYKLNSNDKVVFDLQSWE